MQGNYTIAVIIIVLFAVLALVGFAIWYVQTGFSRIAEKRSGGSGSTSVSSGEEA